MPETIVGPGYYSDLSNDDYHAASGISKSHLDAIHGQSPRHYWYRYLRPDREHETTDALEQGSIIHTAVLEPETFEARYVVPPRKWDRRKTIDKEEAARFELHNAGRHIIDFEHYDVACRIRDAVHADPIASALLTGGRAEESFFAIDHHTGELVKCRTDYRLTDKNGDDMIIDVKSAVDASEEGFGRAAGNYRYDLQPAWYLKVLGLMMVPAKHFVWIAFEKEPPYVIGIYYATPELIAAARGAAERDYMRILHYRRLNEWPGYSDEIRQLQLPGYIKR